MATKDKDIHMLRCADCEELFKKNRKCYCGEGGLEIHEVKDGECPLDVTFSDIADTEEINKNFKVDHGAKAEKPKKERKKPERKPDLARIGLIKSIAESLPNFGCDSVTITNETKIIEFMFDGKWYKIDLICSRNKNKSIKK